MSDSCAQSNLQIWVATPHICNVDPQMMPNYKIQAVCVHEGCEEIIPFTMGLVRDMRKHFNEKHRLLCKACKENFRSTEDREEHLKAIHGDNFCSECHASFTLTSAIAMHIESSNGSCSVRPQALANALRRIQADAKDLERQKDETDPNAIYSPISCSHGDIRCSPEEIMFRKLKEFRRTLLRAHKEALSQKQQEKKNSPSPTRGTTRVQSSSRCFSSYVSPPDSILQSGFGRGQGASSSDLAVVNPSVHGKGIGYSSQAASSGSVDSKSPNRSRRNDSPLRDDQDRFDNDKWDWTCATCVVKFTTLSQLLQHVESRVINNWWKSMNK